jgi:cellulose synthase (UDP-forming)
MIDLANLAPIIFVIGVGIVVLPFLDRDSTAGRLLPCLSCLVLIVRTLHWRLTATLPPFSLGFAEVWAYLFAALETMSGIEGLFLFLFLSRTVDRRPEARRRQDWVAARRPSVDVFIPTYNEPEAILDRTILGALSQTYDNLRVFVLDDTQRGNLKALCHRRGVGYITRADNADGKAGNMNNALAFLRKHGGLGEFVAILDADFIAQPNFLARALALFYDPRVGCVQTPQHFSNPDPLQHSFHAADRWPDEQRFFFDVLLASKDAWGVAFNCGTSSITRLSALEAVGDFPVESVTEDVLLSIKLKTRGWRTVYLNERLSVGLAPEGLSEYITQRGRWCLGFMQIARSPWGPFTREKLPLIDRMSLIDSLLYWAMQFPFRLMCLLAPSVSAFTGSPIVYADWSSLVSHTGVSLLWQLVVLGWLSRGRSLPILTDASQALIIPAAIQATVAGLVRPKGHKFRVTAKGGGRQGRRVRWGTLLPLGVALGLTIAGIVYQAQNPYTDFRLYQWGLTWLLWSYYTIAVLVVAILTAIELPRRADERFPTDEWTLIEVDERGEWRQLSSISMAGATVRGLAPMPLGSPVSLAIEGVGVVPTRIARAVRDGFEASFDLSSEQHDAMLLKLFSGRYRTGPEKTDFSDIIAAVALRVAR